MANKKEYKEFFLTLEGLPLVGTNGNLPTNQETPPFVKRITTGGITYPTIFKKDGVVEPVFVDDIWLKFLNSITFKLNQADRANDSNNPLYIQNVGSPNEAIVQGLVTLATDIEAKAWQNGEEARYSRVPRASQLPEVNSENNLILASSDFDITLIPQVPVLGITHRIDPAESNRNKHLVKLSDDLINWYRDSLDAVKVYVDGVDVSEAPTSVVVQGTADGQGSSIQVQDIVATATRTKNFLLSLNLNLDTDGTFSAASNNIIPSQLAVKTYIDALIPNIGGLVPQASYDSLLIRVNGMQGTDAPSATEKADQVDLDALITAMDGKLSSLDDDTAQGIITFVQVPKFSADPVAGNDGVRLSYLESELATKVDLTGDTMTGLLVLSGTPVNPLGAATKAYVDTRIMRTGDTMMGALSLFGNPISDLHAVPKQYVDAADAALQAQINAITSQVSVVSNTMGGGLNETVDLQNYSRIQFKNGLAVGYNN